MALTANALITLAQAKEYLKVSNSDNDNVIEALIESATRKTEDYCASRWVSREITETHIGVGDKFLYLWRMPISEVTEVTIDAEAYTSYEERLTIGALYGAWPSLSEIIVTYTAGYIDDIGTAVANIPDAVIAVMQCVAIWFNNPLGATTENIAGVGSIVYGGDIELPDAVKAKLSDLRKRII